MKNEYCVTWNLYKSWVTANMFKGKSLFFRIFWCFLLVLMIVFGIISLNIGDVKAISIYFFLLSLLCLYNAFLRHILLAKKTYRKLSETYGKENWTRSILFENDNILLTDNNVSIKYKYSDIVDIKEKEMRFLLFLIINHLSDYINPPLLAVIGANVKSF